MNNTGIPETKQPTPDDVPIGITESPMEKLPKSVPAWPPTNISPSFPDQKIAEPSPTETGIDPHYDYPAAYPTGASTGLHNETIPGTPPALEGDFPKVSKAPKENK